MERHFGQCQPLQQWQLRGGRSEKGERGPPPRPETLCPHKNTLDDYDVADIVCMDCGLVLDRLLGGSGGGQRIGGGGGWYENVSRHQEADPPLPDFFWLPPEERERRRSWESILHCLSVFHMDTEEVARLALENYWKIYGGRQSGKGGFRKNQDKETLAIAFSICNTLAREGIPRPPNYVADVCGVSKEDRSKLLKIPSALALGKEELQQLRKCDYELKESEAEDYIDTLCSILGVPFHLAGKIRTTAQKATWLLHGRLPTVLAAASMQLELRRAGLLVSERKICELLDCKQKSVSRAITDFLRLSDDGGEKDKGQGDASHVEKTGEIDTSATTRRSRHGTHFRRTHPGGNSLPRVEKDTAAAEGRDPAARAKQTSRGTGNGRYQTSNVRESQPNQVGVQLEAKETSRKEAIAGLATLSQLLQLWTAATSKTSGGSWNIKPNRSCHSVSPQEIGAAMDI